MSCSPTSHWQNLVSDKEAESARLRSEISRLRQALTRSEAVQRSSSIEVAELQAQLQQAGAAAKSAHRQTVLSVLPAGETARAELYRLEAELESSQRQVSRLESELESRSAASGLRLSELQDSFQAKISDLRGMHADQLASAHRAAEGGSSALLAEAHMLRQQLQTQTDSSRQLQASVASLRQAAGEQSATLQQQGAASVQLQQRHASLQQECTLLREHNLRLTTTRQAHAEQILADSTHSTPTHCSTNGSPPQPQPQSWVPGEQHTQPPGRATHPSGAGTRPQPSRTPVQEGGKQPGIDADMVGLMEGQLQRLSQLIREKESEVGQVRHALQQGLDERRALLQTVDRLQQQVASLTVQVAAQSGMAQSGGGAKGAVLVSPSRPHRAMLPSKGSFK
ncbi:MAG: hypothetical protein WDW38_001672 [Sanguina aurantia]